MTSKICLVACLCLTITVLVNGQGSEVPAVGQIPGDVPAPETATGPPATGGGGRGGKKGGWGSKFREAMKKKIEEWCAAPVKPEEVEKFACKQKVLMDYKIGDKTLADIDVECRKTSGVDVAMDAEAAKKSACDKAQRSKKREVMKCIGQQCKASDVAKKACRDAWKQTMGCWMKPKQPAQP